MKCIRRNRRPFYYALYNGLEQIMDEHGRPTGQWRADYKTPVLMRANISPGTGAAQTETFGTAINYDRVIVTDDMSCPIDEHTVLCVDVPVGYQDGALEYDYVVRRVARSLNSIAIAISRVDVS